jgi:hypothetical protein
MRTEKLLRVSLILSACLTPFGALAQNKLDNLPPDFRVHHLSGDGVQPAFEGWRLNEDGTVTMWFGYYNRNTEEKLNIPVGPNNKFDPEPIDRQQPAYFYPGFHQFVFRVDLPKGWPQDKKLIWTVTANGTTLTANGWMATGYEVDKGVIQMNLSAGGNDLSNEAPTVDGPSEQTAEIGKPLALTVVSKDDGLPKGRSGRTGGGGLRVRWEEYRGPGEVYFDLPNATGQVGKPFELTTRAEFSAPGTYWLRATAFDGQLEGTHDVRVTVMRPKQ